MLVTEVSVSVRRSNLPDKTIGLQSEKVVSALHHLLAVHHVVAVSRNWQESMPCAEARN